MTIWWVLYGDNLGGHIRRQLTHAYFSPANIRAVNVCALKLGLEPVINDVTIDPKSLFLVSQQLSVPERMLAYAQHGDFEKMHQIFTENRKALTFDLTNHWVYSRIADEYIKHGQPTERLKNYLESISTLEMEFPVKKLNATPADEAKRIDNIKAIENSKTNYYRSEKCACTTNKS